jgi:DNA-binding transcriptional LysR family regulator
LRQLADNLTDLAIMVRPPDDADTVRVAFAPHAYVIVAAPGHPLVGMRRISRERLLQEPFIVREKGSDTFRSMQDAFGSDAARIRAAMEIASNETIKQAVAAGFGLGFLSAHAVQLELELGRLVVVPVKGFPVMRLWYVVQVRGRRLPRVAEAFPRVPGDRGRAPHPETGDARSTT